VRATDAAGNTDPTPAVRTFTVDTSAPDTTIDAGPAATTSDATPELAFSADQAGSTFECRIDGGAWAACTSPHTIAALGDGPHTFEVRATDTAGNVDPTPPRAASRSTQRCPTPRSTPAPRARRTTPRRSSRSRPTSRARRSSAASTAAPGRPAPRPRPTASLADGDHTFEVRATDPAGNTDATPATRTFTVDTAVPETSIESGPAGPTSDATPDFSFSADQAGSTFDCRIDGGAWAACTSPQTVAALADGDHTFEVRATDPAGNADPTPATRAFTVDTAAPDTSVDSGPTGTTTDPTPTFDLGATETGSTFECRLDGGAWAACATPFTTATLVDGPHTLEARATDAAANTDATPASRPFTVDTGPPATTITDGPSGATTDRTPTFSFTADEPAVTFECRVDGGAWAACTSPHTTAGLADGDHLFEARATDTVGNVEATPARRSFSVDTAAPQTSITSGPSGTTDDDTPTFELASDDAGRALRVPDRRWGLGALPVALHRRLAERRRAHARGPGGGRGGQRRRHPGVADLPGQPAGGHPAAHPGPRGPGRDRPCPGRQRARARLQLLRRSGRHELPLPGRRRRVRAVRGDLHRARHPWPRASTGSTSSAWRRTGCAARP
jgi:hypothetical protein